MKYLSGQAMELAQSLHSTRNEGDHEEGVIGSDSVKEEIMWAD